MSQAIIRKTVAASFTKTAAPRTYDVTMSTARSDRELDSLPLPGWIIPRFVPLLWGHDHKGLPIGRVWDVHVAGDALRGRIEFPPTGVYDFADTVVRLIETGFLGSVSVGFRAIDRPTPNDLGGLDFAGAKELLELSVVNVPANEDARIDRMDAAAMAKWLATSDEPIIVLDDEHRDVAVPSQQVPAVPGAVVHARADLVNFLGSLGDEGELPRYDGLRRAINKITTWLEGLSSGRSASGALTRAQVRSIVREELRGSRHIPDPDEVVVVLRDDPSDMVTFDASELPHVIATSLSDAIGPVIQRETRRALDQARGRIPDFD